MTKTHEVNVVWTIQGVVTVEGENTLEALDAARLVKIPLSAFRAKNVRSIRITTWYEKEIKDEHQEG